ncbi:hypothetical protein BGZ63DRAFT_380323 [Mariannaea sp. PMI_226]|nr:hypothetical protein BGZ63DRAFT_380323 [Mariannaea sp. PMI_226]
MPVPQPPPPPAAGSGANGSFITGAPGIGPHVHLSPPAVAQYRMTLGMGLEAYAPVLGDAYRPAATAAHQDVVFNRMHAAAQAAAQQQQPQPAQPGSAGTGQFGLLAPVTVPSLASRTADGAAAGGGVFGAVGTVPVAMAPAPATVPSQSGQGLDKMHGQSQPRLVVDPPDLEAWREKLFNVNETIVLTHEQFETYFPHVDNVYSHRSTQRYKRKPFVSHYWDCRMKGRPPGTPKSDDPNKKKRKRSARERDLCDVKIKITEYFPGAQLQLDDIPGGAGALPPGAPVHQGVFVPSPLNPGEQRIWTIQRVNGNGGNGKGDGVSGPHKHTLAKSDEIKRNSVQRLLAKQEKEAKKKPFVRKATGVALATAKKHNKENDLKLHAACFCPFSQRVWIALEAKGIAYQYCETDPFRRPALPGLPEANPRDRIPALQQGAWTCTESSVILEYLEDSNQEVQLFPTNPQLKANCRLWIDHINTRLVPAFFALLKTDDPASMREPSITLQDTINSLVQAANEEGPFFLGSDLSLVDIHFAPFALCLSRILSPMRSWPPPEEGSRLATWIDALERNAHVGATMSNDDLYVETAALWLER